MGDPVSDFNQQLSKRDQDALKQLEKICQSKKQLSFATMTSCATMHQHNLMIIKQDAENRARLENEANTKASIGLGAEKQRAYAFVQRQVNSMQTAGLLLHGALFMVMADYDLILQTRASKPIVVDILFGVVIAALPELKIFGRSLGLLELAATKSAKSWPRMEALVASLAKATPGAAKLDAKATILALTVKNPVVANKNLEAASAALAKAHHSKTEIISNILSDLQIKLAMLSDVEVKLAEYITNYERSDVLAAVVDKFDAAKIGTLDYTLGPNDFGILTDLLLYDMLRAYVGDYMIVRAEPRETIDDLPTDYDRFIDGFDQAQRNMVYARFGKVKWTDPSRPSIRDYKDLVRAWGAKITPDAHRRSMLNVLSD